MKKVFISEKHKKKFFILQLASYKNTIFSEKMHPKHVN